MDTTTTFAWAPITKTEEQDDGTMMVYGPAASSDLDRANQRLNPEWLDGAMPAWFAEGANVREQHDVKRAVGVGVGLAKGDGDSHLLAAHIVDPVACLKVRHKVLKGFSVGIKNPKIKLGKTDAPGGEIVGGSICEVSVVDRPCNPTTMFEIAKADGAEGDLELVDGALVVEKTDAAAFGIADDLYEQLPDAVRTALTSLAAAGTAVTAEPIGKAEEASALRPASILLKMDAVGLPVAEDMIRGLVDSRVAERLAELQKADTSAAGRRKAAAAGTAMADGSYPITSKGDLRKAIRAVGRGGVDHDAIRRHIIKRAKALGLEGLVPKDWKADGTAKDATKADDTSSAATDDQAAMQNQVEGVLRDVRALVPALAKADGEDGAGDDGSEGGDITSATDAIACIARLIISEAESLAEGNLHEATDIRLLLDAVSSLKWFNEREQMEQDNLDRADKADGMDTAQTAAAGAPTGETAVVTKAEMADLVKAAVAEATSSSEERITTLEGDLTKATSALEEIKKLPTLGGPVLTRNPADAARARTSDADRMRAEAAELLTKADRCQDRELREGYLERRRDLLAKADA
ncbi:hypothetical protein AB0912_15700 [Streptomyces sp. NPDC007084]|uniref:hypothetical protein n=1 Tax=Streptomyces sp. NPDC007084 TaxID=3154313 RepID=UPI0034554E25